MTKIGAVTHQQTKAREIGKQHAIDEKPRAIVDDDWRLAHFFRVTDNPRDGRIGSALAANHFDQRHAVYRVEEMHAAELLGPLQHAGQLRNRDCLGVAGENGVCIYFSLALSQHALLHLEVFYYSLDDDIECIEALIIQRWANTRQHTRHFLGLHASASDALQQLRTRFGHTRFQSRFSDILHQDRHAFQRRLVGNATAHDAGAKHG